MEIPDIHDIPEIQEWGYRVRGYTSGHTLEIQSAEIHLMIHEWESSNLVFNSQCCDAKLPHEWSIKKHQKANQ